MRDVDKCGILSVDKNAVYYIRYTPYDRTVTVSTPHSCMTTHIGQVGGLLQGRTVGQPPLSPSAPQM